MGRLIDADALIENIKGFTNISEGYFENPRLLVSVIEEQPTAYDVEKVVEQLEDKMCESLHMDKETFRKYEEHKYIIKLTLHEVESIVRAGGKR